MMIGLWTNSTLAHEVAGKDTLRLKTEKHRGYGLLGGGFGRLDILDISEEELLAVIPPDISEPTLGREFVDLKLWAYENIQNNHPEILERFIQENYPTKIDTANILSERENSIRIILGMRGADSVYIVDENGNGDYRDDPVRMLEKLKYGPDAPDPEPVACHYWIYNGKELVRDSGWVLVGINAHNTIRISVAQHMTSNLSVDGQTYGFQAISWLPAAGFCFDSPNISITSHNGVKKDSILLSERFELGEYLKLGDSYYRFEKMTNDGSEITLIREADVSDKIGKQVGFIAPDFACVSTAGDSISLHDYRNEYVLLVNITACWSEPMSYEHYKELSDKYLSKIDIVAIDASEKPLQANIKQLKLEGTFVLSPQNRSIQQSYREDYCSRTCFLIDPNGQLVDKFEIYDWEEILAKHFQ